MTIRSRRQLAAAVLLAAPALPPLWPGPPVAPATVVMADTAAEAMGVASSGAVASDPEFTGPQVTKVRIIEEGPGFVEIYWDRYVDEEAAVSPEQVTITSGGARVQTVPKPPSGPTSTIFFDRSNTQVAATPAQSMSRLSSATHLASLALSAPIGSTLPVEVTVLGSRIRDAQGRPGRDATFVAVPVLSFYSHTARTSTGILVKAGPEVGTDALDLVVRQVDVMLAHPDDELASTMSTRGCSVAVFAAGENAYLVPEHRSGYDPAMYDVEGYGGTPWNGCVSSISERNVRRQTSGDVTSYPDENILVHEFGHAVRLAGIEALSSTALSRELTATYDAALAADRWPNTYAISNVDEYFATLSTIWFDQMSEAPDWTGGVRGPVNTRAELLTYDPRAHALLSRVYPADQRMPSPWDVRPADVFHPSVSEPPPGSEPPPDPPGDPGVDPGVDPEPAPAPPVEPPAPVPATAESSPGPVSSSVHGRFVRRGRMAAGVVTLRIAVHAAGGVRVRGAVTVSARGMRARPLTLRSGRARLTLDLRTLRGGVVRVSYLGSDTVAASSLRLPMP